MGSNSIDECKIENGYREEDVVDKLCMNLNRPAAFSAPDDKSTSGRAGGDMPSINPVKRTTAAKSTDKTKPATGTSTAPQEPAAAQSDASADTSQCEQATRTAVSCCDNPESCLTDSERSQVQSASAQAYSTTQSGQGINSLNQSSTTLNSAGSNVNTIYATACFRSKALCNDTCNNVGNKYTQLSNNCSGCSSSSVYQQAISRVNSAKNTCSRLSASTYSAQSLNNAANQGLSGLGDQLSQAQPSNSAAGMNTQD
ncbi:MAG: hypothetical protein KF799_04360, partial [Bdellovibrionales bacterium]|nr:hypothetical protein [Bdellovibrionales bacterium]